MKAPGAPPLPSAKGGGKVWFQQGTSRLVCSNISPDPETGAGRWTDAQLGRAIRRGIGHDGRQLSVGMPFNFLSVLADEDLASIVVYLRSIPPVRNALPKTVLPAAEEALFREGTLKIAPLAAPAEPGTLSGPVRRGEHLVRISKCADCHTPADARHQPVPGLSFAGGEFEGSAVGNITPDPSGIGWYDEALFIQTIRTGRVGGIRELNPAMPWAYFRNMTDEDLKAVFAYLRTLKPVRHRVSSWDPPTRCRRCGGEHGLGELN